MHCADPADLQVESAVVDSVGRHPQLAVAMARSGGLQSLLEEGLRMRERYYRVSMAH